MTALTDILTAHQWHYGHTACTCGVEIDGDHLGDIAAHQAEAVAAVLQLTPEWGVQRGRNTPYLASEEPESFTVVSRHVSPWVRADGIALCARCNNLGYIDVDSGWCQECLNGPLPGAAVVAGGQPTEQPEQK